jgi:regulator of sigma E protease
MTEILIGVAAGVIVVLLFGLAVFVHELGHFLAARHFGFVIDVFSIGFGPALWKRKYGGTEYRIGCIPLGGYVALPQLDPSAMETIQGGQDADGAPRTLPAIAPWRRILVALAGPAGNVVLAVVLALVIYASPGAVTGGADTTVGTVETNSPAYAAGLRMGDRVLTVNGQPVTTWTELLVECHLAGDLSNGVRAAVDRGGGRLALTIPVRRDAAADLRGIEGIHPVTLCVVAGLSSNAPAAAAGVRPDDIIEAIDRHRVCSVEDAIERIRAAGETALTLSLRRAGKSVVCTVTPRHDPEAGRPLIGVSLAVGIERIPMWMQYRKPMDQLEGDVRSIFRILEALLAPRTRGEAGRAAGALSGPIAIAATLWVYARVSLLASLGFIRFLCVNLAVLNLLPLPVLDGGHILFALWEIVTRRKPSPRVVNALVNVFAVLLILLIVVVMARDVPRVRLMFRRPAAAAAATNAAPRAAVAATDAPTEAAATDARPAEAPATNAAAAAPETAP